MKYNANQHPPIKVLLDNKDLFNKKIDNLKKNIQKTFQTMILM